MALSTPQDSFESNLERLENTVKDGEVAESDKQAIETFVGAFNEDNFEIPKPDGEKFKSTRTLANEVGILTRTAKRLDIPLTDADASDINQLMSSMVDDYAQSTVRHRQAILRSFYGYTGGVDPEDITLMSRPDTTVDERDMLDRDEIQSIRNTIDHPRDMAMFDLFLYTGQRNAAIRFLRIQDIDVDAGVYYLNDEHGALKGADETMQKRPLLGAVNSIRDWLKYHPDPENPDAYLLTAKPNYNRVDPEDPLSRTAVSKVFRTIKDKADIDKPLHPHALRHNFVTIAKKEYGLDDGTVKKLIGHAPQSNVMNTTYSHLSDDDVIEQAEVAAGLREASQESTLTPEVCGTCGEHLDADATHCPRCGTAYAPSESEVEPNPDAVEQKVREVIGEAFGVDPDPDDDGELDLTQQIARKLAEESTDDDDETTDSTDGFSFDDYE